MLWKEVKAEKFLGNYKITCEYRHIFHYLETRNCCNNVYPMIFSDLYFSISNKEIIFSINSEANTSKFLENIEDMFPQYYMQ